MEQLQAKCMYYLFKCFPRFAPIGYKREWNWITNLTKTLSWNKVWSLEQLTSKMHSIDSINRYFLYGTLHRFWFEPFFAKWIETSVCWDITSCRGDFSYQVNVEDSQDNRRINWQESRQGLLLEKWWKQFGTIYETCCFNFENCQNQTYTYETIICEQGGIQVL